MRNKKMLYTVIFLVFCILFSGVILNVGLAHAEDDLSTEGLVKERLINKAIYFLAETSALGNDAIEDYTERSVDRLVNSNGLEYWHVLFIKLPPSDDELLRSITVAITVDGEDFIELSVWPTELEALVDRLYKDMRQKKSEQGDKLFALWSPAEKYDFVAKWQKEWSSLPKGSMPTSGYPFNLISKKYLMPDEADLSDKVVIETASRALAQYDNELSVDNYAIGVSFILDEDEERTWQVFFIPGANILDHPGYRIDIKGSDGTIKQLIDFKLMEDFYSGYGYES
jgi:hypothetical protein